MTAHPLYTHSYKSGILHISANVEPNVGKNIERTWKQLAIHLHLLSAIYSNLYLKRAFLSLVSRIKC